MISEVRPWPASRAHPTRARPSSIPVTTRGLERLAVAKISARNAAAQAGSARARARPAAGRARSLKGSAAAKLARSRKAAFTATENYATARTHLRTDVFRDDSLETPGRA